jgi:hypothetical protein
MTTNRPLQPHGDAQIATHATSNGIEGPFYTPKGLTDIRVDYGPADELGRFFLLADYALQTDGITLEFRTFDELAAANRANSDSWRPMMPTFNPKSGLVNDRRSFALLGRDSQQRIVSAQAVHIFDWAGTTFKEEAESMRLLFADPVQGAEAGEFCTISAKVAGKISGRIAFSGGVWLHPAVRKRQRFALLSRIARAYAYTRWRPDLTLAVMSNGLIASGFNTQNGYRHVDFEIVVQSNAYGLYRGGITWIMANELFDDLASFMVELRDQLGEGNVIDATQDKGLPVVKSNR